MARVLLFANTDWYLLNFRLPLIRALDGLGVEVILVSPPGRHGAVLEEMGYRWIPAPMERRSLNPIRELRLLLWLRRLYWRERVNLIHAFTVKCAIYSAIVVRTIPKSRRARVVSAIAGMGYVFSSSDIRARILRPLVRLLFKLAFRNRESRVILQNADDVSDFVGARLTDPSIIRLIRGSGVDCTAFSPIQKPHAEGTAAFVVLLAARLLWDKGVGEYIEAARILLAQGRNVRFLLAGEPDEGNPASVPRSAIDGWAAEGLVEVLGHVADMPTLLRSVDLVVLPSYREGLPKGLIEAGACQVPVVTTDVPGCRDLVSHAKEGLLVPARDPQALSDAIAFMQDNPKDRAMLASALRHKVVEHFAEDHVLSQTFAVYRELVSFPDGR